MEELNRLILVNKTHRILEDWSEHLHLSKVQDTPDSVRLEEEACQAFQELQACLLDREEVILRAADGYRSLADQQRVWDELLESRGEAYVRGHVAKPGYSEHHTGLAADAELDFADQEDARREAFPLIPAFHRHLAEHGFILRYPAGKESITGYEPEWWHIRYVGTEHARAMEEAGLVLEEYLEQIRK